MDLALLDTDTLSEVFKGKSSLVANRATEYLRHHREFAFSAITRYELLRGLREKNASTQIAQFDALCRRSIVLPLTEVTFNCAVDLGLPRDQAVTPIEMRTSSSPRQRLSTSVFWRLGILDTLRTWPDYDLTTGANPSQAHAWQPVGTTYL